MKSVIKTILLLALLFAFPFQFLLAQNPNIGNAPIWNWVQKIGGSANDNVTDIIRTSQGDIYQIGTYNGAMTIGNTNLVSIGLNEAFIARFNAAGVLQWVQTLKGADPEAEVFGQHIALDNNGNVIVSGIFKNGNMVAGGNTYIDLGSQRMFVAQLAPIDGSISWVNVLTQFGSSETSVKLVTDSQGGIYCKSQAETYKVSSSGTLIWNQTDQGFSNGTLAYSNDKLYLSGVFYADLSIGGANFQVNDYGVFICELDSQTGAFSNARLVAEATGYSPALTAFHVRSATEVYLAGNFRETLSTGSCSTTIYNGFTNAFLLRYGSTDCDWLVSQSDPLAFNNSIQALSDDGKGNIWVAGTWGDQLTLGGQSLTGELSTFLAKVEAATGIVSSLVDYPGGILTLFSDDQGTLVAGRSNYTATWSQLNASGVELQKTSYVNDGGYGLLGALEMDNTGLYLTASVSGKFKLGNSEFDVPERSMLIAKLNHTGTQVLWHHVIPRVSANFYYGNKGFLDKKSGKFYCLGDFSKGFEFNGQQYAFMNNVQGAANFLLVQVDVSGTVGWVKTFSGPSHIDAVAADQAGNVLLSGIFVDDITIGNTSLSSKGDQDFFLTKLDPAGNVLWAQRGGGDDTEYTAMLGADAQNNIYLTCEAYSLNIDFNDASILSTAEGDGNIVLAKYNPSGVLQWSKIYGKVDDPFEEGGGFQGGFSVDAAGNSYMAGFSAPTTHIGAFSLASPYNLNQFVAKFDPSGDPLWANVIRTRRFGFNFGELDFDTQGNLYCAAQFRDSIFFGNTAITAIGSFTARNAYYARFNGSDGVLDWATFVSGSTEAFAFPTAMALFKENNLYVGGYLFDILDFGPTTINSGSGTDAYLGLLGPDIMVSTQQLQAGTLQLDIFPNPASTFVQWKAPEALPEGLQVALLNSAGQSVYTNNFPDYSSIGRIELRDLPAGVYYLNLISGTKQTLRKVVVE